MSDLTEIEIFSRMGEEFRLAAEDCEILASAPYRGATYNSLRHRLRLIEGCIRQAGFWRDNSNWFKQGLMIQEIHKRSGNWLRANRGQRFQVKSPLFLKLAENLRALHKVCDVYRTARTGVRGPILPEMMPAPHRDTRPVQVPMGMHLRDSGLIVPA